MIFHRGIAAALVCWSLGGSTGWVSVQAGKNQGRAFTGLSDFSDWRQTQNADGRSLTLISPLIVSPILFDELVVSWNASRSVRLEVEAQVKLGNRWSEYYSFGHWVQGQRAKGRQSVSGQKDGLGRMSTDTLILTKPVRQVRLRVGFRSENATTQSLKFVGLSFTDSKTTPKSQVSDRQAWGRELTVPRLCQYHYPGGKAWCSPTTVTMSLAHWSSKLSRKELTKTVPLVAAEVFDPGWDGTGNWIFNTAYAGSFSGMRSFVVRLSDIVELESFVKAGIPVPVSVAYKTLKGEPPRRGDGHLIVCIGFDRNGNIVVNDPAKDPEVRWVYPRSRFVAAWAKSKNTAYVIHPESVSLPTDLAMHWSIR